MSKFLTPIPIDVQAVLDLLPVGACVESIRWNPRAGRVEVQWDHGPYRTGHDFPLEFPVELLKDGQRPKGVSEQVSKRVSETAHSLSDPPTHSLSADARTPEHKAVAPARRRR